MFDKLRSGQWLLPAWKLHLEAVIGFDSFIFKRESDDYCDGGDVGWTRIPQLPVIQSARHKHSIAHAASALRLIRPAAEIGL